MSDVNAVILSGRLCADPEIRYTPKGMAVAELRLASNRKRGDREDALFTKVTAFEKLAEVLSQHKHKGDNIIVIGRLALNSWEKDGVKHSQVYVIANEVTFGSQAKRENGNGADHDEQIAAVIAAKSSETSSLEEIPF